VISLEVALAKKIILKKPTKDSKQTRVVNWIDYFEENLNNSIILAAEIQDNFTNNLEEIQGIKQQPLWVLDAVYMQRLDRTWFYLIRKKEVTKF
jgi:hypothetical protein